METNKSLLERVYDFLLKRGDEFEWVNSAANADEKTGIAYFPYETVLPCSFLFTEATKPHALILDVVFAAKVPADQQVEMSLTLGKLNDEQRLGSFRLDTDTGYVYYRQTCVLDKMELTDLQLAQLLRNFDKIGLDTADQYAQVLENEFPS
ncbi:MAG: YbjN domain-containing protein [Akkermansia sp.]